MRIKAYAGTSLLVAAAMCGCKTTSETTSGTVAKESVQKVRLPAASSGETRTPLEQLQRVHTHRVHFNARTSGSLIKTATLPEAESVLCGKFHLLAGRGTLACVTRSGKNGQWEKVIIDLNHNSDLTDDPAHPVPGNRAGSDLTLELNGKKALFTATATQNRGNISLVLKPTECWTGRTDVGGESSQWMACDCNLNGKLDSGDKVYLDGDDNGRLIDGYKDPTMVLQDDSALYIRKKWYGFGSSDGKTLEVGPYEGKMSKFTIDHSEITDEKDLKHDLRLFFQDRTVLLQDVDPVRGIDVPQSKTRFLAGSLKVAPRLVRYSVRDLDLTEDKTLTLSRPEVSITLSQSGGKIHVSQKITSANGVSFSLARAKPGPVVEIFSEKNPDEPLTKGNMAYG